MSNKDLTNPLMYLGRLCPRKHDYNSTGKSLRYKSNYDCCECHILLQRQRMGHKERIFTRNPPRPEGIPIPEEHYLGRLCKYGHNYLETGYSLKNRFRTCVICVSIQSRSERSKKRWAEWKQKNISHVVIYNRSYYQKNKERVLSRARQYEQTPKGKMHQMIGRHKRRANLSSVVRIPYTAKELLKHFEMFGNECVYCGSTQKLTADHVIAIAKGGADALSNLVPCCYSCNASKQARDYAEWYVMSKHFNLARLEKIAKFIGDVRL